jgi:mono/diheme cytochrome c family protein
VPNRSALLLALAASFVPAARAASAPAGFQLIEQHCLACHGEAKMGGLDLRTRDTALAGGKRGPALTPGDARSSRLYQAATHKGDLAMPPSRGPLPEDELAVLRDWIDSGAAWPQTTEAKSPSWWSFKKPERPQASKNTANSIDAFILASLEKQGLQPLGEADRRTLIRRLTFDLHGLPPTPEEVDAFIQDPDPRAYEKLVDRLLESPRYGERWGRHWLDVVRYADTGGFETDVYFANAWRYRDYVIESLNRDKPYNQFVREQVAADEIWPGDFDLEGSYLLPESKKEYLHKLLGTGLYTLGAFPVEITFYGDQYRAEWEAESVDLTGAAFLGLTLGCARCHDHKFRARDPHRQPHGDL